QAPEGGPAPRGGAEVLSPDRGAARRPGHGGADQDHGRGTAGVPLLRGLPEGGARTPGQDAGEGRGAEEACQGRGPPTRRGDTAKIERVIEYCIRTRFLVLAAATALAAWGVSAVLNTPVDAVPDLSENQVIVFTDWMGRSPREIEDQVTYPLSLKLQGLA